MQNVNCAISSIIIAASILSTIIYNKNDNKETEIDSIEVVNKIGNTSGNLANDGIVAQQGDWIYYKNGLPDGLLIEREGFGKLK